MPIYEYQCNACGHLFENMQKISEEPLKTCPKCHKDSLKKLISAAGFQLKGTGWYATDFRNKGKAETENKSDQGSHQGSASGDNKGSDTTQSDKEA